MVQVEDKPTASSPDEPKAGTGQTGSTSNSSPPSDGGSPGSPPPASPSEGKPSLPSNSPENSGNLPNSSPDKPSASPPPTKPTPPPSPASPPNKSPPIDSASTPTLQQPSGNGGPPGAEGSGGVPGSTRSFSSPAPSGSSDRQSDQSGANSVSSQPSSPDKPSASPPSTKPTPPPPASPPNKSPPTESASTPTLQQPSGNGGPPGAEGSGGIPGSTRSFSFPAPSGSSDRQGDQSGTSSVSSQPSAPPPFGNPKGIGVPSSASPSSPAKETGPSSSIPKFGSSTQTDGPASPTFTPHGSDPGSGNFPGDPTGNPFDSSPSKSASQQDFPPFGQSSPSGKFPGGFPTGLSSSRQGSFGSTPTPSPSNLPFKQGPQLPNEPTLTSLSSAESSANFPFTSKFPPSQSTDKSASSSPVGGPSQGKDNPFDPQSSKNGDPSATSAPLIPVPTGRPNNPSDPRPDPSQGSQQQQPSKTLPFTSSPSPSVPSDPQFPPFQSSTPKPLPSPPDGKSPLANKPPESFSTANPTSFKSGGPATTSLAAISISIGSPDKPTDKEPSPTQNKPVFSQPSIKPPAIPTSMTASLPSFSPDHPTNQPDPSQDPPPQAPAKSSQKSGDSNAPAPPAAPTRADNGSNNTGMNTPPHEPTPTPPMSSAADPSHPAQNSPPPEPTPGQSRPSNNPRPSLANPDPMQPSSKPKPTPNPAPTTSQGEIKSQTNNNPVSQKISTDENSNSGGSSSAFIAPLTSSNLFPTSTSALPTTSSKSRATPASLAVTPSSKSSTETIRPPGAALNSPSSSFRLTTITSMSTPPAIVRSTIVPKTITTKDSTGFTTFTTSALTLTTFSPSPSTVVLTTQVPISNTSTSKNNHTKAIVGAFVGAVLAALVLAAITFFLIRRRYRTRRLVRLQEDMAFIGGEGGGISIPPPPEPIGGLFASSETPYAPVSPSEEVADAERGITESQSHGEYRSVLAQSPSGESVRGQSSDVPRLSPIPQLLLGDPFGDHYQMDDLEDNRSVLSGFRDGSSVGHSSAPSIRSSPSVRSTVSTIRVKRSFTNLTASPSYENDPFSDENPGPSLIDHPIPVAASSAEIVNDPFDDVFQDSTPRQESPDTMRNMMSRLSAGSAMTGMAYEPSEDGTIGCAL